MNIVDELEKKIKDSFCESIHDKLIFICGYLYDDKENEDIFNLVSYLLYSENKSRSNFTLTPSLSFESFRNMCSSDNDEEN